jgi:hypothetical protein
MYLCYATFYFYIKPRAFVNTVCSALRTRRQARTRCPARGTRYTGLFFCHPRGDFGVLLRDVGSPTLLGGVVVLGCVRLCVCCVAGSVVTCDYDRILLSPWVVCHHLRLIVFNKFR